MRGYFPNCRLPSAPPPAARGPCFAIIWNPADVCFGNDKKTAYLQFSCYIGFESCRYSLLLRLTVFNKYAPPFTPLVIYCLTLYWSMCTNVMCAVQLATRMYTLCLTLEQLCALMLCAVVQLLATQTALGCPHWETRRVVASYGAAASPPASIAQYAETVDSWTEWKLLNHWPLPLPVWPNSSMGKSHNPSCLKKYCLVLGPRWWASAMKMRVRKQIY